MTSVVNFLRRVPFTIVMLLLVVLAGVATMTHYDGLQPSLLRRFGFAPFHLSGGDFARLLTSVFLTPGRWSFYWSLAMLAGCVGSAERRVGTWRAAAAFWGIHLATLLIQSVLLAIPLHHFDLWWGKLLATEHDVGPSAGYYGCLGLICQKQNPSRRLWLLSVIGGILLARVIWSALSPAGRQASLGPDIAHLIAFPLGVALGKRIRG